MKRNSSLFFAIIISALLIFIILTTRTGAISLFSPEDLTPTDIPPEILTHLAQESANFGFARNVSNIL
jgi:hypothetical protein